MRNLLALVGSGIVTVAGLGWYLGWYHIQAEPTTAGHRRYEVEVNSAKIAADVKQGADKISHAVSSDGTTIPAPPRPVEGQTTNFRVNNDGSVSYKGDFTFPALTPGQRQ